MQNVIPMVKNALSQNFVVYFNFSTYENRVRMEVHDAAISEYFSDSLALKNPDLLVDLAFIFHQSEDQFFSQNNQNRIHNTQQQVNSKSGMEPSVIIITHKFSGVLRCYFRYQIDLQLQSRRTTRQEEKPVWRETWPKLFGKFPLS